MTWKIRKSAHGGYVAMIGMTHKGGVVIDSLRGYTMPAFIVYEESRFDTIEQAESWIKEKEC